MQLQNIDIQAMTVRELVEFAAEREVMPSALLDEREPLHVASVPEG